MLLSQIKSRVRDLTGLQTIGQLSDADLLIQINKFYRDILPAEIDSDHFSGYWTATTVAGDDDYAVGDDYISLGSTLYVAGVPVVLDRDVDGFLLAWPETQTYDNGEVQAALFYGREIILRPPPDDAYALKVPAKVKPPAFVSDSDEPADPAWGELIAYGTAILIHNSKGDSAAANELSVNYAYFVGLVSNPKVVELTQQRSVPRF